jgi:tetratricopeptide (TPR) repeat protein
LISLDYTRLQLAYAYIVRVITVGMSSDSQVLAGRYQLVRCIGSGSFCDVYEANDLALGSRVALKRFREESLDALRCTKLEFRTLADIHAPGLVRFFDLVVADDAVFFTMEFVDGVTLTEYTQRAAPEDTRAVLGRVARALGELHARDQLHRDVKPANIMVTPSGDVRVLDFGLASASGATAGTLAYQAPELFEGRPPSMASDWYSFGAVLYEVLARRVPAGGRDIAEILLRKKLRRFPQVREVNPDAPAELGDLAWGLLAPDPATRLGTAAICTALRLSPLPEIAGAQGVALFGRTTELAALTAGLMDALDGRPTVVVVEGESGMGKSSLVRTFLASERAAGCCVLASAARPQESVPLRAIDAMVDELAQEIERLPADQQAVVRDDISPELVRAFPVLGDLGDRKRAGASEDVPSGDGVEVRREAQLAFARVLRRLAGIRPVLLWIDDLQWADYESTLFVEAAVANPGAARLFVVLARQPGALPWQDREAWLRTFPRISIGPLDDGASRALLGAHAARHPMTEAAIAGAMREARGNAFLLEFLARHTLRDRDRAGVVEMNAALAAALDGLDRDARILFECVSLAQHPVPLASLGRVLADRTELSGHKARLLSEGLITVDEHDRVRPYHDTLRARAEAALDATTRRSRHALLASAFGEAGEPVEWQIPHLEGSGKNAAAARASISAGRAAAQRYAYEIATTYFEKALGLAEHEPRERARLLEALSQNLAAAGNGQAAARRYEEAASVFRSISDPREALAMQHKAAIALLRSGQIEAGRAALKTALDGLGERLPRLPTLASLYESVRLAIASRRLRSARSIGPISGLAPRAEMRLDTLWTSATTLSMYDPLVANALALRFVRQALAVGEPKWVVRALALEAAFLAALGGPLRARAGRTMGDLRSKASLVERPYEHAWVAATEGSTAWLSGDVRGCYEWTSRARALFRGVPETGAYELALLDSFRLPAMALLGHHDAALESAEDVLAIARARGDGFATLPCLHGHITLAYLGAGRLARATSGVDEAGAIAHQASSPMPAYHRAWSRATIALFRGDGEAAYRVIVDAWGPLRRSGMLRLEAVAGDLRYLRSRCALAAARGRRGGARTRALRDARVQARWLRRSTLAHGVATADAIDAQVAALAGREHACFVLARAASARLYVLGLTPDGDALARWSTGQVLLPLDHVYVG